MIYDGFMFFNELDILSILLHTLDPFVEKFILVESTHTHSGRKKPLYFDEARSENLFKKFENKIIHVVVDEPPHPNRWVNENLQRNAISRGLKNLHPEDIIIISDVDEIINPEVFPLIINANSPGSLRQELYYYYFNCFAGMWQGSVFCKAKSFTFPQDLRNRRNILQAISNGGWHYSYFGSSKKIAQKLSSFAHSEYDTDFYRDEERISKCMNEGTDIFGKNRQSFTYVSPKVPKYINDNLDKFSKYIFRETNFLSESG